MTTDDKQLREAMWDLVYGLLSEEESQALIVRIKSEPDAARLYAEVKLESELVAQAARVEDSSVLLNAGEGSGEGAKSRKVARHSGGGASGRLGARFHRGAAWLVGVAATALAGLLAVGFSWQRSGPPQLASRLVAAEVLASQPMLAGLTCSVEVRTYLVNSGGEPTDGAPANVEFCLVDRAGNSLFKQAVQTSDIGQATLDLPGKALEPGVRLEIAASKQTQQTANAVGDRFAERKEEKSLDRTAAVELPVQPEPKIAYYLPAEPVQQAEQAVPAAEWYFNAFTATPATPEPAEKAIAAGAGAGANVPQGTMRVAASAANGAVQSQNLARAGTQLRALSDKVVAGPQLANLKSQAVIPADQPIPVTVPEQLEGRPLRVAAMNRGITVANQVVSSTRADDGQRRAQVAGNKTESAKEQVSLALPPEADGLVEVQLYDESKNQQEPVERQYVVRQPKRRLHIDVADAKARYSPGEQVALTLRCTDENGKPAADTQLGVRLWNESAIKQSGEEPVLLADAVDQGLGEVIESGAAPAATSPKEATQRANQVGQLAREAEPQATVGQPIELVTNRQIVKSELARAASSAEIVRQRAIMVVGGAAIVGGTAVILLLIMLVVMRLSIRRRVMLPGFAVAIASVVVGLGWTGWLPDGRGSGGIAMAPAAPAAPPVPASSAAPAASPAIDDLATAGAKRLDAVGPEAAARQRDETRRATAEAAPAVASSPAPAAAATTPRPADPAGQPAAAAPQQSAEFGARSELSAAPQTAQSTARGGGQIVTLQVPGSQQARSFNFAKDSEAESANRRLSGGGAGGIAGAGGGRPVAGPPAVVNEQLKQKSAAAEDKKEPLAERAAGKPQSGAAPASLYFNPQLMTDAEGKATIQFTMPPTDAEYRLLVDALGQGRIGSGQQTIVCGDAPSK